MRVLARAFGTGIIPREVVEAIMSRALSYLRRGWVRLFMAGAGAGPFGRLCAGAAGWPVAPFYRRIMLAEATRKGYVAPSARIHHRDCVCASHVFLDDRVLVFQDTGGGSVHLGERVRICRDSILQTGYGGEIEIGAGTFIQPRCQIVACVSAVRIGKDVQIAANCCFYPYNHGMDPEIAMSRQPLTSSGDIVIGDGAWLGAGVIVLDGVTIGEGAVIGAGSVVTKDVPAMGIAAGNPARVMATRTASTYVVAGE